jgi:hypothetical protein
MSYPHHIPEFEDLDYPLPILHLNGSGEETLIREYTDARRIIRAAADRVQQITFHGRDYYPISETAFAEARAKRTEMLIYLDKVERYLNEHRDQLRAKARKPLNPADVEYDS